MGNLKGIYRDPGSTWALSGDRLEPGMGYQGLKQNDPVYTYVVKKVSQLHPSPDDLPQCHVHGIQRWVERARR